jgi:hypothetical protein
MCISCWFRVANVSFFIVSKPAHGTNITIIHHFLASTIAFAIITGCVTGTTFIQTTSSHLLGIIYHTIIIITAGSLAKLTPFIIVLGFATWNHIDFTDKYGVLYP